MKGLFPFTLYTFIGQFIMTFQDDFYIINSTSYIKNVPQTLCTDFLKELKNDDDTLKPHISDLKTNLISYGFPAIKCTIPTCFIEIEYKTSDGHYLITKEVFLYEEDYPSMEALEAYKDATSYGFASQVTEQINDLVDCHHNSQGCMCLSYGDY